MDNNKNKDSLKPNNSKVVLLELTILTPSKCPPELSITKTGNLSVTVNKCLD